MFLLCTLTVHVVTINISVWTDWLHSRVLILILSWLDFKWHPIKQFKTIRPVCTNFQVVNFQRSPRPTGDQSSGPGTVSLLGKHINTLRSHNSPRRCPCPGAHACEPVTSHSKGDFEDAAKWRLLRWGITLDYPGEPNAIARVLMRGRAERQSQRRG